MDTATVSILLDEIRSLKEEITRVGDLLELSSAKLNREQQQALAHYLNHPLALAVDETPDKVVTVSVVKGHLVVEGDTYLHSDGEWATYPEGEGGYPEEGQ